MAGLDGIEILGLVAATFTTSGFIPQVYKTWRTKDVSGLSLLMYAVIFTGTVLWLIYGLYINSIPIIAANVVASALTFTMLLFILLYKNRNRGY